MPLALSYQEDYPWRRAAQKGARSHQSVLAWVGRAIPLSTPALFFAQYGLNRNPTRAWQKGAHVSDTLTLLWYDGTMGGPFRAAATDALPFLSSPGVPIDFLRDKPLNGKAADRWPSIKTGTCWGPVARFALLYLYRIISAAAATASMEGSEGQAEPSPTSLSDANSSGKEPILSVSHTQHPGQRQPPVGRLTKTVRTLILILLA